MVGLAEDRLDSLNVQIAALELERADQALLVEVQAYRGQDIAAAVLVLQEIESRLAALRARTATFEGDPSAFSVIIGSRKTR